MIGKFAYLLNCSVTARKSNDDGLSLFATLRCDEDEVSFGPLSVRVFLRRIMLDLHLGKARLSNGDPILGAVPRPSSVKVSYELTDSATSGEKSGKVTSADIVPSASSGLKLSSELINEHSRSGLETQRYDMTLPLVTFSGSDKIARWSFDPAPQEKYLWGTFLDEANLAKIFGMATDVSAFISIPKFGVFTSPSRYATIKEQRRLNIFALLVRKAVAGKHPMAVDLS